MPEMVRPHLRISPISAKIRHGMWVLQEARVFSKLSPKLKSIAAELFNHLFRELPWIARDAGNQRIPYTLEAAILNSKLPSQDEV
jgi:hypothetical protein